MPKRLTITLNNIPIHSTPENPQYYSARLTVFLFGSGKNFEHRLREKLYDFVEKAVGYELYEWYGEYAVLGRELIDVDYQDAKGLGFYKAEMAFESPSGRDLKIAKIDARTTTFGKSIL